MSRWFVSTTFVICVHVFPRREVLVKVGVVEFGLYRMIQHSQENRLGHFQVHYLDG